MGNWWRWTLRGLAVVALVVGAVLLFQPVSGLNGPSTSLSCPTPFWQILGQAPSGRFSPPPSRAIAFAKGSADPVAACRSAASDREHVIEALGAGAVVLVGVSFLRRRRRMTRAPVEAVAV